MNNGIQAFKSAITNHFKTQGAVARVVGVTPQAISLLLKRERPVPAEWCPKIEAATNGKITRHDLRPDLWTSEGAA